jgi:hypothetical protein
MGCETLLRQRELPNVGDGIGGRPGTVGALILGAAGKTGEAFFAKHFLNGGGT